MPPRYVQLPNGSYLEWPEGVSAAEFKAKAGRYTGAKTSNVRPDTAVDKMFPQGATVSAPHPRTGLAGIEDSLSDLRTRLSMSAQKGVGQGTGDAMASPALGLMKMMQAPLEAAQGHPLKALGKGVGGMGEASKLYGALLPEAPVGELLPSTEKAGQLFFELEKIAGKVPVNVNDPGKVATKIWDLAQAGGTRPKIITDFLRRVTTPSGAPMDYAEMRKFYQNATRLSADEANRLTPAVKRLIGEFTQKLGDSLWEAAQSVGQGDRYNRAMKSYRSAAKFEGYMNKTLPKVGKAAAIGAAGATGAAGAYKLADILGAVPHGR